MPENFRLYIDKKGDTYAKHGVEGDPTVTRDELWHAYYHQIEQRGWNPEKDKNQRKLIWNEELQGYDFGGEIKHIRSEPKIELSSTEIEFLNDLLKTKHDNSDWYGHHRVDYHFNGGDDSNGNILIK